MAGQIMFFKKNIIDIDNPNVTITVTDGVAANNGQDFVNFIRNRKNDSAWMTTDSTDAADTEIIIDWQEERDFTDLVLIKHNWKAFTIKYWNGSTYVDFSTPIAETVNAEETSRFTFNQVSASAIKIVIDSTQVVDADKQLFQLLITQFIVTGQLNGWPIIKNPTHSTNKKITRMASGKANLTESLGFFKAQLSVASWRDQEDMNLVEKLYTSRQSFLVWLCGGDETQFSMELIGYRKEDFYLMRPTNEYEPEFLRGLYKAGAVMNISLEEVVR